MNNENNTSSQIFSRFCHFLFSENLNHGFVLEILVTPDIIIVKHNNRQCVVVLESNEFVTIDSGSTYKYDTQTNKVLM